MSFKLRLAFFIIGWLLCVFWMTLAYFSDFLGMATPVDHEDGFYYIRMPFGVWKIRKTKRNKRRIFIALILFFTLVLAGLCFGTM